MTSIIEDFKDIKERLDALEPEAQKTYTLADIGSVERRIAELDVAAADIAAQNILNIYLKGIYGQDQDDIDTLPPFIGYDVYTEAAWWPKITIKEYD